MAPQPPFAVIPAVKAAALCARCYKKLEPKEEVGLSRAALCTIAFWSLLVPWMNYVPEFHTGELCFRNTQLVCQVTNVHTWQPQSKRRKKGRMLRFHQLRPQYLCLVSSCDVSQIKIRIHGLRHAALKFLSCSYNFRSNSSYPFFLFFQSVIFFENNSTEIWISFAWFWCISNWPSSVHLRL